MVSRWHLARATSSFIVSADTPFYYMEESVLLGTKPLVDSIRHFIWDPSGVFSICHLCECLIILWRHDSHFCFCSIFSLHIIKRTLHVGSKIWILCSCHSNIKLICHLVISSMYVLSIPVHEINVSPKFHVIRQLGQYKLLMLLPYCLCMWPG